MKRILSIGALCAALVLTSCGDKTYTVTFDSKGGSAVAAISDIIAGEKITEPAAPTKDGCVFGGWYKETACTSAWNFASDVVNSDITLYAKWETNPNPELNYQYEPNVVSTLNLKGEAQKELASGVYTVYISDNTTYYAMLKLYPNGSAIEGTYQISFSEAAGTCLASSGGDDYDDFPSYVFMVKNGAWDKSYYLVSGTVTVTSAGVTVNAKSYYGSTINITSTWFVAPDYEVDASYWGDWYENGTHNFFFEIYTYGLIDEDGYLTGIDGVYYYVDFNSASATGGKPQAGTYTFVSEGVSGGEPGAAGTFYGEYTSVEGGALNQPETTGGTLTISASALTINLTCSDGTHSITYDKPISWSNYSFAPARAPKAAKKVNFVEKDNFKQSSASVFSNLSFKR